MALNWLQTFVYGIVSGLTEILPVSAQAHRLMLRKLFGTQAVSNLTLLMIHIGILAAVYMCCQSQILRITRAVKLKRIPKKRRRRPLDVVSLLDYSLLKTMALPMILAFIFMYKLKVLENNHIVVAVFLLVNGIILYIPQYFPGSNRDSRTLSRLQGLLIGLGGALSALPGISGIGAIFSVASICGVERSYAFNMSLLLELLLLTALIVMDVLVIVTEGIAGMSFLLIIQSLAGAVIAFGTTILAVRILRKVSAEYGLTPFSFYCWAAALFSLMLTMFA